MKKYTTLKDFYLFYLTEHSNAANRTLHFIGTSFVIFIVFGGIFLADFRIILFIPLVGYGFAWVGHFFIEKNRPATFTYPVYSFLSDFIMFWHILTNQIDKKLEEAQKTINPNS